MSYILDALKKVDRDRSIGEVPGLETAHQEARRDGRMPHWVWIVAGLFLLNGLLLVLLLQDDGPPGEVAEVAAPQPDAPPASALAIPVPRDPATSGPAVTLRPRVQPRPAVTPAPAQPAPQVATAGPAAPAVPPSAGGQGRDFSVKNRSRAGPADEYVIPEWGELSLEFRSRFSLPRIDVHVYAEDPARRFIMADLKKYREGETMDNGALLEKIHPGSIQLEYQGTRFRVDR